MYTILIKNIFKCKPLKVNKISFSTNKMLENSSVMPCKRYTGTSKPSIFRLTLERMLSKITRKTKYIEENTYPE